MFLFLKLEEHFFQEMFIFMSILYYKSQSTNFGGSSCTVQLLQLVIGRKAAADFHEILIFYVDTVEKLNFKI